MIKLNNLETDEANAEIGRCRESVKRFAKKRGFSEDEAEEITQDTVKKVLQKLNEGKVLQIHCGYFIEVAKRIFQERKRKNAVYHKYFISPLDFEDGEIEQSFDAESQINKAENEERRAVLNDCILECLEERTSDEQELLWQYCFDEKFILEIEEPDSYKNHSRIFLESIRSIRDWALSKQEDFTPITEDIRVKISRLRKKIRECVKKSLSRKKGFA